MSDSYDDQDGGFMRPEQTGPNPFSPKKSKRTAMTTEEMDAILTWWLQECAKAGCYKKCTKDAISKCRKAEKTIRAALIERDELKKGNEILSDSLNKVIIEKHKLKAELLEVETGARLLEAIYEKDKKRLAEFVRRAREIMLGQPEPPYIDSVRTLLHDLAAEGEEK